MVATATSSNVQTIAAQAVRDVLQQRQGRLTFAGRLGAGKTTLCDAISQANAVDLGPIPIFNHADAIKEEVVEWLADARRRAYMPESDATFEHFCNFLGISPGIVRNDMQELVMPVWTSFSKALEAVYEHRLESVIAFCEVPARERVAEKVAWVDANKQHLRSALQNWGQMTKEITGDNLYWVGQTITNSLGHAPCLNGDTRFQFELEALKGVGWTGIYVYIDDETQDLRRPGLSYEQRNHVSERSIRPEDCDFVVDGRTRPSEILFQIAEFLGTPRVKRR